MTRVVLGADLDITIAQIDAMIDAGLVLEANGHHISVDGGLMVVTQEGSTLIDSDRIDRIENGLVYLKLDDAASPPGALTPDDETSNRSGYVPKSSAGNSEDEKP